MLLQSASQHQIIWNLIKIQDSLSTLDLRSNTYSFQSSVQISGSLVTLELDPWTEAQRNEWVGLEVFEGIAKIDLAQTLMFTPKSMRCVWKS